MKMQILSCGRGGTWYKTKKEQRWVLKCWSVLKQDWKLRDQKSQGKGTVKKKWKFVLFLRWDFLRTHIFRHHCGRHVNTRLSWLWGTVHAAPLPVNNYNNNNNKLYLDHFSVFEVNYHMSIVPSLFLKSSGLKMFSVQVKAVFLWFDKRFWNGSVFETDSAPRYGLYIGLTIKIIRFQICRPAQCK